MTDVLFTTLNILNYGNFLHSETAVFKIPACVALLLCRNNFKLQSKPRRDIRTFALNSVETVIALTAIFQYSTQLNSTEV